MGAFGGDRYKEDRTETDAGVRPNGEKDRASGKRNEAMMVKELGNNHCNFGKRWMIEDHDRKD